MRPKDGSSWIIWCSSCQHDDAYLVPCVRFGSSWIIWCFVALSILGDFEAVLHDQLTSLPISGWKTRLRKLEVDALWWLLLKVSELRIFQFSALVALEDGVALRGYWHTEFTQFSGSPSVTSHHFSSPVRLLLHFYSVVQRASMRMLDGRLHMQYSRAASCVYFEFVGDNSFFIQCCRAGHFLRTVDLSGVVLSHPVRSSAGMTNFRDVASTQSIGIVKSGQFTGYLHCLPWGQG